MDHRFYTRATSSRSAKKNKHNKNLEKLLDRAISQTIPGE